MAAPPMARVFAVIALASAKMSDFQVARFAEVQAKRTPGEPPAK